MAHSDCMHEEDFKRLEQLVTSVFKKMDDFLKELKDSAVADAGRTARLHQVEKDIDRAFKDIRDIRADVKIISDWRQRFEGGVKVMLAIPVLCTVITTGVALYKMLGG